jgi:23S rRNA pseudouridine2605 synthase
VEERLQKILARAGFSSRRGAEQLMLEGRVTRNGEIVKELGTRADLEKDDVRVDGVRVKAPKALVYLVLNKPRGVVSTRSDPDRRQTVMDLVPHVAGLFPIGRLDVTTEGLILLTNDGDWAEHVLHPRYRVEREYAVALSRPLTREQAEALEMGVELTEGVATVTGLRGQTNTEDRLLAELLEPAPEPRLTWVRVTIHQGWKRQLRRMFGEVGAPVRRLVRVRIGALRLGDLASGDVRPLSAAEVRRLASTGRIEG